MADEISRKTCIQYDMHCMNLSVSDNPKANSDAPIYEISQFSQVNTYSAVIEWAAAEKGVDARLVKAIMYMETTRGYYDAPLDWPARISPSGR